MPDGAVMNRTSGPPTTRRTAAILAVAVLCVPPILLACCAESTKHQVLTFFFDGVPEPGEEPPPEGYPRLAGGAASRPFNHPTTQTSPGGVVHAHPPYAQSKCGGCHDPSTGRLVRQPDEGLCRICHTKAFDDARFVHGPVAANACLFCHHYHSSDRPAMLLGEPRSLCLHCHKLDDIAASHSADADIERRSCIECHDPHKGSNRFFLKQDGD